MEYRDGTQVRPSGELLEKTQEGGIAQLAHAVSGGRPVLVVAKGKRTAEKIARRLRDRVASAADGGEMSPEELATDIMQRLDARLEREMSAEVELRELLRHRVAYHHAGLPPSVREAVEAAIRAGHVRYVVATTTLAEGVNFPFATVIVQALSIRDPPQAGRPTSWRLITPRTFWNIAGRAGRPGQEDEGQVILYEPSLGLHRVRAFIDPYLDADIRAIEPVRSALADGLLAIREQLGAEHATDGRLSRVELDEQLPAQVQGMVNLVRVGIAHARASEIADPAGELFDATLAGRTLKGDGRLFGRRLFEQQVEVVDSYLAAPGAPPVRVVAELGLSLGTLSRLQAYVASRADWQLESMSNVLFGGRINFSSLPFVVSPVLVRMAELEGPRLSGIYTDTVIEWARGKPVSGISLVARQKRLEDLISFIHAKISYLLPWGLYAFDRFVTEEVNARRLEYGGELQTLAYLIDAGVPDTAVLALASQGIERTDAARLSRRYHESPEARETTDIVRWVKAQPFGRLAGAVRGVDGRRLDFDFPRLLDALRPAGR